MRRQSFRLAVLAGLALAAFSADASAGGFAPHAHRRANRGGVWSRGRARGNAPAGDSDAAGTTGLPRGRRYYNGRYFGGFNNRFYSPQYGYF